MNILFLTQVLPYPLDAGPKVRGYYNLRYLVEKHSITLLSFVRATDSPEALSHLKSLCARVETVPMPRSHLRDGLAMAKSLLSGQPFLITRDEVGEMDLALQKLVREDHFDAIHSDQLWMAPYALKAQAEALKNGYHPRLILDQHNAVHMIPKRMAEASGNIFLKTWLRRESSLMAEFEQQTCRQFDQVVWVTQDDLNAVISLQSREVKANQKASFHKALSENNSIIPICVDYAATVPTYPVPETSEILFVGGMHWPPNADGAAWFALEVLPLIRRELPQARFIAAGKQPPDAIKTLGPGVVTPGYVGNMDQYWANARVFVVPLRAGGGMRVKILDAWGKGIPIVSTTIGAEGISYNSGKDILIADSPDEFAMAVLRILTDHDLAQQLSKEGRATLTHYYDWKNIYHLWNKIYDD